MTTLCNWLALGQGECQKFVPGEHFSQRDMPILWGGRWTRGHHALCPRRAMDMPSGSGGHAHSWRRTISWRWAMDMLNGPGCPEGHAHSLGRPVDTWASCSLPAPSNGHAHGSADMLIGAGRFRRWAMDMLNGPGCPEGHAHSLGRPVDTWASCSLPRRAMDMPNGSGGHAHSWRRAMDMPNGCGQTKGHAHSLMPRVSMSTRRCGRVTTRRRGVRSPRPRRRRRPGHGRRHSGAGTAAVPRRRPAGPLR